MEGVWEGAEPKQAVFKRTTSSGEGRDLWGETLVDGQWSEKTMNKEMETSSPTELTKIHKTRKALLIRKGENDG